MANVSYVMSGNDKDTGLPYALEEVHLYVGNYLFAVNNGQNTVAPSQYPYIDEVDSKSEYTFTVDNLSGAIYIMAYALVSGF